MRDVNVIGSYATAFKKHQGMGFGDLAREAHMGTLSDAGMKNGENGGGHRHGGSRCVSRYLSKGVASILITGIPGCGILDGHDQVVWRS